MLVLDECRDPLFWRAIVARKTVLRALRVAIFVGTVLVAINQGDVLLDGRYPPLWKVLLTYSVPYVVSSYSAASEKRTH